jgi:SAM-dependent methyltransferase
VQIALAFGGADVIGTDVSGESVRIARRLARQLGLASVRFERADLLDCRATGAFDLIFCTGVLHHLEDPLSGLRTLERALAPDGAAVLMLYSRVHRLGFEHFRNGARAFRGGASGRAPDVRTTMTLLRAVLGSRCRPLLAEELRGVGRERRRDLPTFADTLLHPHERHFDIDELMAFVRAGGFRFGSWARPADWHPQRYFDSPRVHRQLARLAPIDQWRVVYWLGARASPLFRFVVEKPALPSPPPWRDEEIRRLAVVGLTARTRYQVRDGRITRARPARVAWCARDVLRLRYEPFYGEETEVELPAGLSVTLGLARRGATVAQLMERWALPADERVRFGIIRRLLPDQLGYLVPLGPPPGS